MRARRAAQRRRKDVNAWRCTAMSAAWRRVSIDCAHVKRALGGRAEADDVDGWMAPASKRRGASVGRLYRSTNNPTIDQ